jgi:hypothetical protein
MHSSAKKKKTGRGEAQKGIERKQEEEEEKKGSIA